MGGKLFGKTVDGGEQGRAVAGDEVGPAEDDCGGGEDGEAVVHGKTSTLPV